MIELSTCKVTGIVDPKVVRPGGGILLPEVGNTINATVSLLKITANVSNLQSIVEKVTVRSF